MFKTSICTTLRISDIKCIFKNFYLFIETIRMGTLIGKLGGGETV